MDEVIKHNILGDLKARPFSLEELKREYGFCDIEVILKELIESQLITMEHEYARLH